MYTFRFAMTARLLGGICLVLVIFVYTLRELKGANTPPKLGPPLSTSRPRKALVVASLTNDDVSWLAEYLSDWEHNVYVVNDPHATLTVAKNKGRESTAYLTYIIDNYDNLPDHAIFLHGLRYQWHNEDPMYDGVPMLQRLRLSHVDEQGYVNLRCTWTIGCPAELHDMHPNVSAVPPSMESAFVPAIRHLFPEVPEPSEVGVGCGAQFAVSRAHVLKRPVEDYERVRNWLWETELEDALSGRILEYSWHRESQRSFARLSLRLCQAWS